MPGELIPYDTKELAIFNKTEPQGWVLPSITTGYGYVSEVIDYSKNKIWEYGQYGKSLILSKESEKQVGVIAEELAGEVAIMIRLPRWFVGNFSYTREVLGCTYKTFSGAFGALYSTNKLVNAIKCKDPVCAVLSSGGLVFDLLKIGSNIFPYHHNCTKNDAINALLKITTEACEKYKVCEKLKDGYSAVKGLKDTTVEGGRFKKLWGVVKKFW